MYFVTQQKLEFTRNVQNVTVISRRNPVSLQLCHEVNVAIATIALPVVRFLHSLTIYNLMGLASQLGYFRLAHEKIA